MFLELIIGPMFSGKSSELIRQIRIHKAINKNILIFKPTIDKRYTDEAYLASHNIEKEKCITTDELMETLNFVDFKGVYTIFIDEGQFFPDLKKFTLYCVDVLHINVIISSLDGDYKREPIGQVLELIPHCDKCVKLTSKCIECKDMTNAPFTHKKEDNKKTVEIGTSDLYMPLCRKHYNSSFLK